MRSSELKSIGSGMGVLLVCVALHGCAVPPAPKVEHKSDPEMSGRVQSLQKQIQDRDKRIQELETQLDALKLIDEEREKQRKPLRPPTTIQPLQ